MIRATILATLATLLVVAPQARADQSSADMKLFDGIFANWTAAFNRKDLAGSSDLFSKDVTADYQGVPQKNYESLRAGFKKFFADEQRQYSYRYKVHNVYREGDLAAVRITWYLTTSEHDKPPSITEDQGMDVFRRESDGRWRIVNYIAHEGPQIAPTGHRSE